MILLTEFDSFQFNHLLIFYWCATGMPTPHNLYAVDFVETLKKKHESGTYREMVGTSVLVCTGAVHQGIYIGIV